MMSPYKIETIHGRVCTYFFIFLPCIMALALDFTFTQMHILALKIVTTRPLRIFLQAHLINNKAVSVTKIQ